MNLKTHLLFATLMCCFFKQSISQYSRLGFKNDINGGFYNVNYNNEIYNNTINKIDNDAQINFKNINFRFGGSLIGAAIFNDDSKFFIGDYYQVGLGMGIGNKTGSLGSTYNGQTFNLLLGTNLGLASSYSFSEDFTIGLKVICIGGDLYIDYDRQPLYANGLTFHPTAQYKGFLLSAGFGGRTVKSNPYKTLDLEFRYNFSKERDRSMYIGVRYQKNGYQKTELNYNYSQSINSTGILFGYAF